MYREAIEYCQSSHWSFSNMAEWLSITGVIPPDDSGFMLCPTEVIRAALFCRRYQESSNLSVALLIADDPYAIEIEENSFRPGETDIEIGDGLYDLAAKTLQPVSREERWNHQPLEVWRQMPSFYDERGKGYFDFLTEDKP